MADKIKMEVLIMDSMIAKFRQMGDKFGTIINKLRQAQGGIENAYIGDSSIKIQRNIDDTLKSGKEITETLYKLSIQLNSAKDAIIRADKDSYNNIKLNTIIRGEEDFSKVKDSKDTISNMEKVIGYFGLGAMVSISDNLALNIPNLTGLYNDKRLRYNLENENRYGVLAAYQYGKTFGDIEGLAQGTVELFGGLSIMGFGGLGAGALTVATDGAAAPAVPLVESAGIALAGHGIGVFGSSLYNMGSDFSKGNFYFSEMKGSYNKPSEIAPKAIKDVKKKWGQKGIEAFEKAKDKGIVGAQGQNGIKKLKGKPLKGKYTYEIKVKNKEYGDFRIYGYESSNGDIVFDLFDKALH
ncbi:molecular chaperone Hsp60 [Clostridium felsineum]|uniref:Uncharacterized protein n=1 Tax=Clostridium felsineum TaxID=36839 RepID=A0A1S8L4E2_9CLOT|nr:molecular chaperone Hsp60 [Clostridium felsineum]URZ06760.1 hypothetical protein CLROS_020930 [Clostridium felsineum]URZ11792.1 hypothetical protein CROST_025090 [Clostridium felsineum]